MNAATEPLFGIGFYTVPDASRLLDIHAQNIRRWLGGYQFKDKEGNKVNMAPLWTPQIQLNNGQLELGFRDLIELRFVKAFMDCGLKFLTIRNCLHYAKSYVNDGHPFSTRRFQTDGRTIFLESVARSGEVELLDLRNNQYAIKQVIERTFKDLDIEDDLVARWRPYRGRKTIVIDPRRSFGQPIVAKNGVPTAVLFDALEAEGSEEKVGALYEVPLSAVRDAVAFEKSLLAA